MIIRGNMGKDKEKIIYRKAGKNEGLKINIKMISWLRFHSFYLESYQQMLVKWTLLVRSNLK